MDSEIERYYRVLNLEPTASPDEVYQAYRDLVRIWDPQRFVTQPNLELMAEAKLKEIIEAYNALTKKDVSGTPAPPETPQLLNPVPDHVIDRNVPAPLVATNVPMPPPPGMEPDEPAVPRPLSAWEMERPASYPKLAPVDAGPKIQFAPPPPPPIRKNNPVRVAAQFSAFLIPLVLVGLGLYLFSSGSNRTENQAQLPTPEGTGAAKKAAPRTGEAAPAHHAAKASTESAEEEAPISLPTGAQLMRPQGPAGAGRFRIANHSGQDAVVRVTAQGYPNSPLRLVFVQAGTEVPIEGIGTGVYMVSISLGTLTKAPRKFAPPLGPFQFMQIESADGGPQSDDYELVLKPTQ